MNTLARQRPHTARSTAFVADPVTSIQDLRDMLNEHWGGVLRQYKRLERLGEGVNAEELAFAARREMALALRDEPGLITLMRRCCHPGTDNVDLDALRACAAQQQEVKDWEKRFKAYGCVDARVQAATTGVVRSAAKYMKEYHGPPYAVTGDSDHMQALHAQYFMGRCDRMRQVLTAAAKGRKEMTAEEFGRALNNSLRYGISEREIDDLLSVLDPKKTGTVSIDDFLNRFSVEYLKPKSLRNTVGATHNDGKTNALQWLASLSDTYSRKAHMHKMQSISPRMARKVGKTRSSLLREEVGHTQRKWLKDIDTLIEASIPVCRSPRGVSVSPRHAESPRQPSAVEQMFPPPRSVVGLNNPKRRVRTTVTLDPVKLGNVAAH
jgi:hypothetical protein